MGNVRERALKAVLADRKVELPVYTDSVRQIFPEKKCLAGRWNKQSLWTCANGSGKNRDRLLQIWLIECLSARNYELQMSRFRPLRMWSSLRKVCTMLEGEAPSRSRKARPRTFQTVAYILCFAHAPQEMRNDGDGRTKSVLYHEFREVLQSTQSSIPNCSERILPIPI